MTQIFSLRRISYSSLLDFILVVQILSILPLLLGSDNNLYAQRANEDWSGLMQREKGWLGADGVYSISLRYDAATGREVCEESDDYLWLFSDTLCGATRKQGKEFEKVQLVNHSFAILEGSQPIAANIKFLWEKNADSEGTAPKNIIDGHYWLQDGVRYQDSIWLTAISVGKAWKPDRIDVVEIPLLPGTHFPDFNQARVDTTADLSFKTEDAQIVLGAAICDDSEDDNIYIFGYVDRFHEGSRKDAVVARVQRDKLKKYPEWEFYNGGNLWSKDFRSLLETKSTLVPNVSTEFSVSKIPCGKLCGKWLLVYTPGVISDCIAFRVGDSPIGPYGSEHIFYRSEIPRQIPGVQCYNAKAHPSLTSQNGVLVSYNVNRLGSLARRPEEYRPRFVELLWETIESTEETSLTNKTQNAAR